MEEKVQNIYQEFKFFNSNITFYQDIVKAYPDFDIANLRLLILKKIQTSLINQEYDWLINFFHDLKNDLDSLTQKIIFLDQYYINIDITLLEYLINNVLVLKECLETVFKDITKITEEEIEKISSHRLIRDLCMTYIILKEEKEEENEEENAEVIDDNSTFVSYGASMYIREIKQIPIMSHEESIAKFKILESCRNILDDSSSSLEEKDQAQKKYDFVKNQIIEGNLRLVLKPANHYKTYNVKFEDLIQEGNEGLMKAVDHFEYQKGYRFSTYATWWIRQAITRHIADYDRTIRIPVHMVEQINSYKRVINKLIQETGLVPDDYTVAEKMGVTIDTIQSYKQILLSTPTSLNATLDNGNSKEDRQTELLALVASDENIEENISDSFLLEELNTLIMTYLSKKEEMVIRLRFGIPHIDPKLDQKKFHYKHTLEYVGKIYNVTRERIRQIENKAIKKLRHRRVLKKLQDYSGVEIKEEYYMGFWQNFIGIDKAKVLEAIAKLSKEEQQSLYFYYGKDLNSEPKKGLTPAEYQERYRLILKIKRIITDPTYVPKSRKKKVKNGPVITKNSEGDVINISGQEHLYFKDYLNCTDLEYSYVLNSLDPFSSKYKLLTTIFGPNLDKVGFISTLNSKDKTNFNAYIRAFKRDIIGYNSLEKKNFQEYLEISLAEKKAILESIDLTDPLYKPLILLWHEDLEYKNITAALPFKERKSFQELIKNFKWQINRMRKNAKNNRTLIMVLASSLEEKEHIKEFLFNSKEYQTIFKKVFQEDLEGSENLSLLTPEEKELYFFAVNILKKKFLKKEERMAKKSKAKKETLAQLINVKDEDMPYIIEKYIKKGSKRREYFEKVFGPDLLGIQNIANISKEDYPRYYSHLSSLKKVCVNYNKAKETSESIPSTIETKEVSVGEYEKIASDIAISPFQNSIFASLTDLLPIECRYFTKLRIGANLEGRIYTISEIAQAFKTDEEYVREKVNQGLAYFTLLCKGYEEIFKQEFPKEQPLILERIPKQK